MPLQNVAGSVWETCFHTNIDFLHGQEQCVNSVGVVTNEQMGAETLKREQFHNFG